MHSACHTRGGTLVVARYVQSAADKREHRLWSPPLILQPRNLKDKPRNKPDRNKCPEAQLFYPRRKTGGVAK